MYRMNYLLIGLVVSITPSIHAEADTGRRLTNSVGMKFTYIEPGEFVMGDSEGEFDEEPHRVTLTKPYYMGTFEVTNQQWQAVMGEVPSKMKKPEYPVERIDWEQATAFCRKLSDLPGEQQRGNTYRLPTEAEWEYACRAGSTSRWSFGDREEDFGEYGWFRGNSEGHSHPVGLKKPNQWGLYDMHGNIKEWCSDNYAPFTDAPTVDPDGVEKGPKVVRSGSWFTAPIACRSADRMAAGKTRRYAILGMRVVLEVSKLNTPDQNPVLADHNTAGPCNCKGNEFWDRKYEWCIRWKRQRKRLWYRRYSN